MLSPKGNHFLKEVLSYVKFRRDREDIRAELEGHILDRMEEFMERGHDKEEAEQLSIEAMGDAKELGVELNKQHNPILGWIWLITNIIKVIIIVVFGYIFIFGLVLMFPSSPIKEMPKEKIVYRIDIDEKVKIDDRVLRFTDLIYDKDGNMNVYYEYYYTKLWGIAWSFGYIGEISDDLGHTYYTGGGQLKSGIVSKGVWSVSEFSQEADTLIISYDRFNRAYRVEIDLKAGEGYE